MALGLSNATMNSMLNALKNVSWQNAATYIELHIGDPGAAGTANPSVGSTARNNGVYAASASGALGSFTPPTAWTCGTATETISHIAVWSASTSGNFLWSQSLTVAKAWATGDTLTLNTCGLSITPLAA